jgi:hypothetical protein
MLSGVAIAFRGLASKTLMFGAKPSCASDGQRSFRDKTFHAFVDRDGLLASWEYTFPLILENVDVILASLARK